MTTHTAQCLDVLVSVALLVAARLLPDAVLPNAPAPLDAQWRDDLFALLVEDRLAARSEDEKAEAEMDAMRAEHRRKQATEKESAGL